MATADEYAAWIVKNADKKGTPDFEIVASAYRDSKLPKPASGGFDLSTAKPVSGGFDLSTAKPWVNDPIIKRAGANPWDNDPIVKLAPNVGTSDKKAAQGDGIQVKIAKAKAAGYSDAEIVDHLGASADFGQKIKTATAAGYKPSDIVSHLAGGDPKPEPSTLESLGAGLKKAAQGAAMGVSDIGNTVLNVVTAPVGKVIPQVAQWNRTRNADFDAITEQNKDSTAFKGGRLAGNIAATLPVGGTLAAGVRTLAPLAVRAGASAPVMEGLANAVNTGGFTTRMSGATTIGAKAANLGIRATGGAITGGAASGLINQDDTATGAAIGGILPTALGALGPMGSYLGRAAASVVQPFTTKGQEAIAGRIIRQFAEGGPTTLNAAQLVPGSLPTLAEATGNAGLATFQRGVRDMNPNAFVAREQSNAGARNALLDSIAGDTVKLDAAKESRDSVANVLYKKAIDSDAMRRELAQTEGVQKSALDYARRGGMGSMKTADQAAAESILPSAALQDLQARSTFRSAVQAAGKLAKDKGEDIGNPLTSVRGLHYVKLAIDDMLETSPTNALARNAKSGVLDTKNKLVDELAKLSPQYDTARTVFADMSQPVNAMEALQGLKLTDAQGNITLAKVKNAMEGLEKARRAPGVSPAKSIDDAQMKALEALHADLLRQANLGAGRSIGSNTFQNIATNNILSSLLPGKLGEVAGNKVGGVLGQVGKLAYSGPNEAIRNKLLDMALQPELAAGAFASGGPRIPGRFNALLEASAPTLYRAAPGLTTSR